jgi:hypothetical protein
MYHSTPFEAAAQDVPRPKWQEPRILIERSLAVNAQVPDPNAAPLFGPLSATPGTDP